MLATTVPDSAARLAVLVGITTPISDIALPDLGSQPVLAIVTAQSGTLAADTAAAALLRGSGSRYMTMSGTTAQIATSLATLVYTNTVAGSDELSVTLLTASGMIVPVTQASLAVIPLSGRPILTNNPVSFDGGTLTLESQTVDGPDLALREPVGSRNATTVILINSTIGAGSSLTVRNDNASAGLLPRVAIAGRVELDGKTDLLGSGTAVSLARGSTLANEGSMTIDAGATRFTGAGTFVNDGTVRILGGPVSTAPIEFATALAGTGRVVLTAGAALRLGAGVGAGETIRFDDGANVLHLVQPGAFAGVIAGFSTGDTLVLDGVAVSDALYTPAGDNGVLMVRNGGQIVAAIRFERPDAGTAFHLATDNAGNAVISLSTLAPGVVDVFRFFDTANGTQLLTQDVAERDTILTTRADLRYEGVALHAVDPAHATPDAVDVYRFFDAGNGTHFMTSSPSERDAVLANRPDLVYEPSSTMVEHATAQAGDAAVFRFFDKTNGTHFYTAEAGERAAILSTRPEMTPEGIAFYAPRA